MTLLGILWAAYLPSQPFVLQLNQPIVWLEGDTSMVLAAPLRSRSVSTWPNDPHRGVEKPPQRIETQLTQYIEDLTGVGWPQWLTAASVAVVEHSGPATDPALAQHPASSAHCPAPMGYVTTTVAAPDRSTTEAFIIQVNAVAIGQVPSEAIADQVATQLRQAAPAIVANPAGLVPHLGATAGAVQMNGQTILTLPPTVTEDMTALTVTQWVNNLRLAFNAPPLQSSEVQMAAYGLGETAETFQGTASWYGPYFHGRQTATGEIFDQEDLTAAHKTLPFGTYLEVRNLLNGKTVVVRINDRGPYIGDRSLDLSYAAARCLGSDKVGVIPYEATVLAPDHPHPWQSAKL